LGTYNVILTVTDDNDNIDTDTTQVIITATNTKPNKPDRPTGETEGEYGVEYNYSTRSVDPDGDQIRYLWDWGDGTNSGWIGPYNSGVTIEISHTWEEEGSYEIKVMARDIGGLQSDWSDPLSISMPHNLNLKLLILQILEKLFERFPIIEYFIGLLTINSP